MRGVANLGDQSRVTTSEFEAPDPRSPVDPPCLTIPASPILTFHVQTFNHANRCPWRHTKFDPASTFCGFNGIHPAHVPCRLQKDPGWRGVLSYRYGIKKLVDTRTCIHASLAVSDSDSRLSRR